MADVFLSYHAGQTRRVQRRSQHILKTEEMERLVG